MKRSSTIFLQVVIVLIAVVVLALMIRFPLTEGRATNLSLANIYLDPFIAYVYAASVPFFVSLYQALRLLGFIGQNKAFSRDSVEVLRTIKYSAIAESAAILMAVIYTRIFHSYNDDPAGFIALCIMAIFVSIVIATAATVGESISQEGLALKIKPKV